MNDSMNEWMNEWINEWMNERINQSIHESMNRWINESMNQSLSEWINELVKPNGSMNESMNELMNESLTDSMNERMNERTNEWMNELLLRWSTHVLSLVLSKPPLNYSSLSHLYFFELPLITTTSPLTRFRSELPPSLTYLFCEPPISSCLQSTTAAPCSKTSVTAWLRLSCVHPRWMRFVASSWNPT